MTNVIQLASPECGDGSEVNSYWSCTRPFFPHPIYGNKRSGHARLLRVCYWLMQRRHLTVLIVKCHSITCSLCVLLLRIFLSIPTGKTFRHYIYIDGRHLLSSEGTATQGDPLAMAMYSVSVTPLIASLQDPSVAQVWLLMMRQQGYTARHV